jgi:NADPH:quinone reductase-like Zn-dependent oxidoreductase
VTAAAVNPADVWAAAGQLDELLGPIDGDHTLGWDVAGTVAELGEGATAYAVGDRVVAMAQQFPAGPGTHADEVVLPAADVVAAPRTVDAVHAATLPLNALTAAQALDLLRIGDGGSLLVTGAAGAVGGYAVELAAHAGLRVVAAARAQDEAWLRSRGAADVVTEGPDDLERAVRDAVPGGVDATVDAAVLVGPALGAVRDGGAFVSLLGPATPAPERGVRVERQAVTADGQRLGRLVELLDRGILSTRVASVQALSDAPEAYTAASGSGLRGRVVLVP